jgi:hypothetical protein
MKPFVLVMIITYSSFEEQLEGVEMRQRSNVNTMGTATVPSHSVAKERSHVDPALYCHVF